MATILGRNNNPDGKGGEQSRRRSTITLHPYINPSVCRRDMSASPSTNEYADHIIDLLLEKENSRMRYTDKSPQAAWRPFFVCMIQEFAKTRNFSRTTVHLAVYFFDLFMDNYRIDYWRMHMVALTCIWLAAKLEESSAPKVAHLNAYLTYPYASQDYASLERIMVKFFDWNLLVPTAATFLEYYVEQITLNGPQEYHKDGREHRKCTDGVVAQLASNYLDIALTDCSVLYGQKPSILAASCIAAARHAHLLSYWSQYMETLTKYTSKDVETNMLILLTLQLNQQNESMVIIPAQSGTYATDANANHSENVKCSFDNAVAYCESQQYDQASESVEYSYRSVANGNGNHSDDYRRNVTMSNNNDVLLSATAVIWSNSDINQPTDIDTLSAELIIGTDESLADYNMQFSLDESIFASNNF